MHGVLTLNELDGGDHMGITVDIDYRDESDPVLHVLGQLTEADDDYDFNGICRYWYRRGVLTPKQMNLVSWRLQVNGIEHTPTDFHVSMEEKDREAIHDMKEWQREQLLPYLTQQQKQELGL